MKKVLTALFFVPFILMGGCAGLTQANLTAEVSAFEKEVQADANLVCGFIPTIATIGAMIPGGTVAAPAAASIAEAVCAAVAAAPPVAVQSARLKSATLGGPLGAAVNVATVRVPGVGMVPISGTFTK